MNRRDFLKTLATGTTGATLAGLLGPPSWAAEAPPANRPNIIIVLADDMGWRDTGYQGSPAAKTPHLDDLATKNVRFDYFYPAQQMCSPGRFGIMTGRNPFRTGLHHLGAMRPQEITLAEALKTAGYSTGHFGKWHLGGGDTHPVRKGFDLSYFSINYFDIGSKLAVNDTKEFVEVKGDSSVFTMDLAIDWIRKVSKDPKPFFAYVCFGSPHAPHKGADEFKALYKDADGKVDFLAEVSGVDAAVGKLRAELRKLGIADNTIVWFTSDNGGITPQSMDPSGKGKMNVGVRTVACMEWPGRIKQPIRTDVVCAHTDFYPTLLDITGVQMPNQPVIDGVSLLPLLEGKMKQRPKPVGFMLWNGKGNFAQIDFTKDAQGVWIDGQYKLIVTPPGHSGGKRGAADAAGAALHDIYADPAEKTNLASRMPDQVAKMRQALEQWQKSVRDGFDGKDYVKA